MTNEEISLLCSPIFEDIKTSFGVVLTRTKAPVILITRMAGGEYPIIGMYWTGDEWIPSKWGIDGKWPSSKPVCELDLDLNPETYNEPELA